jgi:hypothetical protein
MISEVFAGDMFVAVAKNATDMDSDYATILLCFVSIVLTFAVGYASLWLTLPESEPKPKPTAATQEPKPEQEANTRRLYLEYIDVFHGLLDTVSSHEYILNYSREEDAESHILAYDQALRYLYEFMKTNNHPNTEDLNRVCYILSMDDHPDAEQALQWLLVARCVWRASPYTIMVPWVSSKST